MSLSEIAEDLDPDAPSGKHRWWRYDELLGKILGIEQHAACEAPRHLGRGLAAVYVWVLVIEYGPEAGTSYVQGMCIDCMERIAGDMGRTAEEGADLWVPPGTAQ